MTTTNDKTRAKSIRGLLLCFTYILFIIFLAEDVYSTEWEWCGGNRSYYYDNGSAPLNLQGFLYITGFALLYVLPWIFYFIGKVTKIKLNADNNPFSNKSYIGFTLFLIICHYATFLMPYYMVYDNYDANVTEYIDLDFYGLRIITLFSVLIGTFIYIPVSILALIKIRKQIKNNSTADKEE